MSKFQFTTQRPVAIIMVILGIAVFGFVSYNQMSWDLMPEISYPTFTVRTEYTGAAPEEVENVVSRPLEEQLSLIKDLNSITSVSRPEQSDIVLEFNWEVNLDRAAQEIREKIDQVYLDREVKRPMILRYDPSLDPVLRIAIKGKMPLMDLRQIVEDEIARDLESLDGVAAAKVKGGFEKEILIRLDEKRLAATGIRFSEVTSRLSQENVNLAGGNIKEGETEYIVRTLNEFSTVKEIGDIIVARKENIPVRLKDIAQVDYSHKERQVITRVDGEESVQVDIFKEADANIVEVCTRVRNRLLGTEAQRKYAVQWEKRENKKLKGGEIRQHKSQTNFLAFRLPSTIDYRIVSDQSVFIQNSIDEVKSTAVIGGILAILILYLFLRNFGTTVIVAVSIPLSIIATFAPLKMFDVNMNIMSLGGLALGIGMLVDSSIVVMESIFRCREEGDGFIESAVRGVSEVGGAVVASTLTTIAVFLPIVFVEGVAGQIFGDLSLAVVFSLLASLMISLFFIPMLASRKFERQNEKVSFRFRFQEEKSVENWLMIPVECTVNFAKFMLTYVVSLIILIAGFVLALLDTARVLFGGEAAFYKNMDGLRKKFSEKNLLWEGILQAPPLNAFINTISKRGVIVLYPVKVLYSVIRFLIQAVLFVLMRTAVLGVTLLVNLLNGVVMFPGAVIALLMKWFVWLFDIFITAVNNSYKKMLDASLRHANGIIGAVLILFVATIYLVVPRLGSELIPEVHQGTLYVNITMPVGTPVEKTDRVLNELAKKITALELVKDGGYFAGTTKDELNSGEVGEHIGKLTINVKESSDVAETEEAVIKQIRDIMGTLTDMDYNISRPVLFTVKPPVELILRGYNLEQLRKVSHDLFEQIGAIEGLKDVQSSIKPGFPELVIEFNRARLSHYGLNAYDVATLIKNKIEGFVATKYKERDKRIDIRVYLKDEQRKRAEHIKNLIINPGGAVPITLSSVANVNILSGPNEIRRVDQDRSAVITANIDGIELNKAVEHIYNTVQDYPMPPSFNFEISGQNKEMETSLNSLLMAMALAIFLVYIVMASQFESFLHPLLILFTIPMALIGVYNTLWVLNIPLSITVYIGMITLVGIVVNNAIVLIDYINLLRDRGMEKVEAIRQAGVVRFRPILITTLTTVLGLLPMALGLGEGAEIRTPMAVAVIAGLATSTFLTLVLIPVVYRKFSK